MLFRSDEGIIRARAKILATIAAARIFEDMKHAGEDFSAWLWSFVDGEPQMGDGVSVTVKSDASEAMSKALKKRGFKFCGPVIVYAFMQAVGMINDHATDCPRRGVCAAAA